MPANANTNENNMETNVADDARAVDDRADGAREGSIDVVRLRPHHLLCTQGYSGKGYSDDFVAGMDWVTKQLRENADALVEITFSTDSICEACPSKYGEGLCRDDDKVLHYDTCVREILDLKEGIYSYHELLDRLDIFLIAGNGDDRLCRICGDCNWYPVSACRENILSKRYVK